MVLSMNFTVRQCPISEGVEIPPVAALLAQHYQKTNAPIPSHLQKITFMFVTVWVWGSGKYAETLYESIAPNFSELCRGKDLESRFL